MRKNVWMFMAVVVMTIVMAGCSNEQIIYVGNETSALLPAGEDVIRISLSNSSLTRTPRPIGSSEKDNNINRIVFRFLTSSGENTGVKLDGVLKSDDGTTLDKKYDVDNNVLILPSDYDGTTLSIKFSDLGENTAYKIIAYGYNSTEGSIDFPYMKKLTAPGGGEYVYSCNDIGNSPVEEIFAGCNEGSNLVGVNQHGKFQEIARITLTRQVAGLLAYMKEVPAFVDNKRVKKITISTHAKPDGFRFPAVLLTGSGESPEFNGVQGETNANVDLLTFDMVRASNYGDKLESGDFYLFDKDENKQEKGDGKKYLLAEGMSDINGLKCDDNTLFGSCFLFPFWGNLDLSVKDYATLNICYWDVNNNLIRRVPLRKGSADGTPLSLQDDAYQYDIRCNNFYSIGVKKTIDNPDDTDEPISIDESTGYDFLNLTVDDSWIENGLVNR